MDASFDYYKVFYYVAKYSNFTKAANAMLSSQPAVTRSIQNLESELGCRLFIRSHHGVTLTPEGKLLYRYVAPACERILRGEEELGLALGLHGGSVSIGATETALHCLLLDCLSGFQREHPDVKIRISNGTTAQVLSDMKEGRTDLAVIPTPFQLEKPYTSVPTRIFLPPTAFPFIMILRWPTRTFFSRSPRMIWAWPSSRSGWPPICWSRESSSPSL